MAEEVAAPRTGSAGESPLPLATPAGDPPGLPEPLILHLATKENVFRIFFVDPAVTAGEPPSHFFGGRGVRKPKDCWGRSVWWQDVTGGITMEV